MNSYETGLMDHDQLEDFIDFFDKKIGTDYDVNDDPAGSDKFYVVCFELEHSEVKMLQKYEEENIGGGENG